jgi:hypothetical protein
MNEIVSAEIVKKLTQPILEKGFTFEYFYQKGGDSSCVYVYRYKKGKDFWDWREVSGSNDIHIVVCVDGTYAFPSLKYLYKKEHRLFNVKHLFRKPTMEEKRRFVAELLCKELASGKPDFFGIKI